MIAAEVADWSADLVVMATQGRGRFDRWLIGSVTQAVLTKLPTSVLVIPMRDVRVAEARSHPALDTATA
jgi:nucleotide-binding universal stress UspA family protein